MLTARTKTIERTGIGRQFPPSLTSRFGREFLLHIYIYIYRERAHWLNLRAFFSVHGNFSEWTSWTDCTKECENGTKMRGRSCDNPPPQHGGAPCEGDAIEMNYCNVHHCPGK